MRNSRSPSLQCVGHSTRTTSHSFVVSSFSAFTSNRLYYGSLSALDVQMDIPNLRTGLDSLSRAVSSPGRLQTPRGPVSPSFPLCPSPPGRLNWLLMISFSRRDALYLVFPYVIQRLPHRFRCRSTRRWLLPRQRHVWMRPSHAHRGRDPRCPERDQRHLPNRFRRWR